MNGVVETINKSVEIFKSHPNISFEIIPFSLLNSQKIEKVRIVRIGKGKNKLLSFYGIHGDEEASSLAFAKSPDKILQLNEGNFQYVGVLTNPLAIINDSRTIDVESTYKIDLNRNFNVTENQLGLSQVLENIIKEESQNTEGEFLFVDHHDSALKNHVHAFDHGSYVEWNPKIYSMVQEGVQIGNSTLNKHLDLEYFHKMLSDYYKSKMEKREQIKTASGFTKFILNQPHSVTFEVPIYTTSFGNNILSRIPRLKYSLAKRVEAHAKADQFLACKLKYFS